MRRAAAHTIHICRKPSIVTIHPQLDQHSRDFVPSSSPVLESLNNNIVASVASSHSIQPDSTARVRSRSQFEEQDPHINTAPQTPSPVLTNSNSTDPEEPVRKRQRLGSDAVASSLSTSLSQDKVTAMRPQSDQDSLLSISPDSAPEAGPSSAPGTSANGYASTNGSYAPMNGFTTSNGQANGVKKYDKGIVARVMLPGRTLYDDTHIDREEFVRLVIQSLRDVGYTESAATLEAESGYTMESAPVSAFRHCIMEASWGQAENALLCLGVTDQDSLLEAKFLISQQKYLELLEAQKMTAALHVLRNELAALNVEPTQLRSLSSLMMCSSPDELRDRAGWDGAGSVSRMQLLTNLQRYIPPSAMIPPRRFMALLEQSRKWQQERCQFHNSPADSLLFSLYKDHQCDSSAFPEVTTTILEVHTDEVWNLEWSHSGEFLASASKDKSAIIWRIGPEGDPSLREYSQELILRDHPYPVGCIAWSLDDLTLLTSSENVIKLWNTKTGLCMHQLDSHHDTVTALRWLPDDSGFISGALDRRIIIWDVEGTQREHWGTTAIRVTDLAVTPDLTRLVAVGIHQLLPSPASNPPPQGEQSAGASGRPISEHRMIIYDMATKQTELSLQLNGDLTSVRISCDSKYALINHAPDEIHLWDIGLKREIRTFTGQRQGRHVIRSCFGGVDGNFVASGSEDGNVYVWHRDTGTLLEVLSGHGEGSVNSVAWNPKNERMFASCSDDHTIRIWEALSPGMVSTAAKEGEEAMNGLKKAKGKGRVSV